MAYLLQFWQLDCRLLMPGCCYRLQNIMQRCLSPARTHLSQGTSATLAHPVFGKLLDLDPNVETRDEVDDHASRVSLAPNDGIETTFSGTDACTEEATAITEAIANTMKTVEPVEQRDQHRELEPGAYAQGAGNLTSGAAEHASGGGAVTDQGHP